ncbi:hypothetical protein BOO69_08205 [Sulfitobacter alexandrii]|uniref:Uncharacterized protein n=1 Tax=Sulfitobacter alexandrii TaxID=1917485 RepID=A0A1J0WGF7_9RHOB|nr:hypothetical protein [Sulfitobacter alexandrii]APE43399.1 hypothetical protein BOO69_08205 [Sulfitobacter alexandrii]
MADDVIRGQFDGLVRRAGGVDAVAAILEARHGSGTKGTVSKMCRGQIGVTIDAVVAVEDFLGSYPITRRLIERIGKDPQPAQPLSELAATCAVAAGEAHGALVRAMSETSAGGSALTRGERTEVLARMRTAREEMDQIIAAVEGMAAP